VRLEIIYLYKNKPFNNSTERKEKHSKQAYMSGIGLRSWEDSAVLGRLMGFVSYFSGLQWSLHVSSDTQK
jgi:hypothetical protein